MASGIQAYMLIEYTEHCVVVVCLSICLWLTKLSVWRQ